MDVAILLLVVLILVLLWRGPRTLPRLGAAFGEGVRAARRTMDGRSGRDGEDVTEPPASNER